MDHYIDALKYLTQRLQEVWGVPPEYTEPQFKIGRCPKCHKHGRFEHQLTAEDTVYSFYYCSSCNNLYAPYQTG